MSSTTTSFTYDATGRVHTVTDSEGYTLTYAYDALDRVTQVTYPDQTYEQVVYDKLDPVLARDRRGRWSATLYDPIRRVVAVRDALGRVTALDWCSCGSLNSLTDAKGQTTTWMRDLQGRATEKIYPDGKVTVYGYEPGGSRLQTLTDAKEQITRYRYNLDDTLKQISYEHAQVATPSVTLTYDANYQRLATLTDGTGVTTYNYNSVATNAANATLGAGRLASVVQPVGSASVTNSYQYDELDRVTNRAINGVAVNVTFDALGRVTVVTNALGSFINSYVNATARLSGMTYPNGQTTTLSYMNNTNDQRLQTIWHKKADTSTLSKFDYAYDADGEIQTWTQQMETTSTNVFSLEYDTADQLLSATVRSNSVAGAILKQFVYGYDSAGNRTSEQIKTGSGVSVVGALHNNLNQLISRAGGGPMRFRGSLNEPGTVTVGGSAATMDASNKVFTGYANVTPGTNTVAVVATDYSNNSRTNNYQVVVTNGAAAATMQYDANGNLTDDGLGRTYEYDAADRTMAINYGTNRTEFTYDGLGRHVKIVEKQSGSVVSTKTFVWCGLELCEERDSSGTTVTKRFFGQGEQIAGTNYFFTRDHLRSVREMTDVSGAIRARYDYDPYGRRTKISGDLDADFGFTGHYYHSVSGLCLTILRAYNADLGKWLNRDLLGEGAGLNLYEYVFNNPINWLDPYGAFCWKNVWRGAAYVAGGAIVAAAVLTGGGAVIGAIAVSAVVGGVLGGATSGWSANGIFSGALGGAVGAATGGLTEVAWLGGLQVLL